MPLHAEPFERPHRFARIVDLPPIGFGSDTPLGALAGRLARLRTHVRRSLAGGRPPWPIPFAVWR